jgi:glycolate oxidase
VPRGAGTSLAGGCLPVGGGVMIVLTRMKRILEVNLRDRYAVVEPGVVNVADAALKGTGYHYAPDPSSQGACTIGGNVATNSGGPHTLKYGVTVNHVLGVELVLPDGRSSSSADRRKTPGYDLTGLFVGSEGTFGDRARASGCGSRAIRGVSHAAGRLRDGRRRHQRDQRHHRRGHHPRRPSR